MRVPTWMLDKTVGVERPEGSTPSGDTFASSTPLACHYEDRADLKLDQRTTSPTSGQMVTMQTRIVGQLDRTLVPGTRVTFPDGKVGIVGNARHYEHRHAPSNTELWVL